MIVANESRLGTSAVVRNFANARQFSTDIGVRYEDLPKVRVSLVHRRAYLGVCGGSPRSLACALPHPLPCRGGVGPGLPCLFTAHAHLFQESTPLQETQKRHLCCESVRLAVPTCARHVPLPQLQVEPSCLSGTQVRGIVRTSRHFLMTANLFWRAGEGHRGGHPGVPERPPRRGQAAAARRQPGVRAGQERPHRPGGAPLPCNLHPKPLEVSSMHA